MKLPPLLVYSVLRLLAFLVPLAVMWFFFPIMRELWWLTVIFAALIGMSISILFLRGPLSGASSEIYERRESRTTQGRSSAAAEDADAEDTALDDAADTASGTNPGTSAKQD
ncbi:MULTISPECIES: DUF4229 domain-containing protein [Microbacterium]|uniref:DUF4229 domain-containing protein n=1 Tax=Microbacterium TaxID=33882 RepID=UPI00051A5F36|nr:DUF4229 domain-containing protein [Microbacterium profundi]MCE7482587.1 DUF4229 domain-containing protein [Microbacterium profundi]